MKYFILRPWYKLLRKGPADVEMVSYCKFKDSVEAKLIEGKTGEMIMKMDGEKYPHPGYPRGHLLLAPEGSYSKFSVLKHAIKNKIFNDTWARLEEGLSNSEVSRLADKSFDDIFKVFEDLHYDIVPYEKLCPPMKEFYRAWTAVTNDKRALTLRDILIFVFQEDDAYRMRFQDMAEYFNPNRWYMRLLARDPVKLLEKALTIIEHCEVLDDMKERIRLIRRVLCVFFKDEEVGDLFKRFCKEVDWKKMYLTKGDRFHFRGKFYKADYRLFEY